MEARLAYNVPLLRRAAFAFWKRSIGMYLPLAVIVMLAAITSQIANGDRSWIVGVEGAVLLMTLAFMVALYFVHYRNALAKLRAMGGRAEARFVADDETFTLESAIGRSTFAWSSIKEVWCFPAFWLLLFSKAQFATIPLECVPLEMQAHVLDRIRSAGGKIA